MRQKSRKLWGRKFDIVKNGLDEMQVIAYVEELHARYSQPGGTEEYVDSLRRIAEELLEDADRMATEIKERAEKESKEKALEIIIQAERQKRAIEEDSQRIHQLSREEAAARIEEAGEKAEQDMAQVKKKAAEKLKNDIGMIHKRLISNLTDLAAEVRALEAKWEGFTLDVLEDTADSSAEKLADIQRKDDNAHQTVEEHPDDTSGNTV